MTPDEMQMKNKEDNITEEGASDSGGIDSIIATIESYIANPKLVTPQTLTELKNELLDLKDYLDNEEPQEEKRKSDSSNNGKRGLVVMIGEKRGYK